MSLSAKVCRAELVDKLRVCALLKRQPRILPHGTLLEASENSLAITVDNLEIAVRVELPASIETAGAVLVPGEKLLTLLETSSAEEVSICARDEKSVEITCGGLSASLAVGALSDFPQRPEWPSDARFEISNFREALLWLTPAASDPLNPQHSGIHFCGDGTTIRLEVVDGRQLHGASFLCAAVVNVVAPVGLAKLARAFASGETCTIAISERDISLRTGEILVRAPLLQGSFPDTSKIIPAPSENVFNLPKVALENALQASLALSETVIVLGTVGVNFQVAADATKIRADPCALGSVETVIEARNRFVLEFRIDPLRLLALLKHLPGDEVRIQCDDPLRAVCLRHDEFLSLIATMCPPPSAL